MPSRSGAGKRYAAAIAGIARQTNSWEPWRRDLSALGRALDDPEVRPTLADPRVSTERKQQLLHGALGHDVAPETRNLVDVMLRRNRIDLLPDVIAWFDDLADRALGVRRVSVTSATPLSEDQRQQLKRRLGGTPEQVVLSERVDPALLGGLVVRWQDIIWDYSVRARLESLRDRLN